MCRWTFFFQLIFPGVWLLHKILTIYKIKWDCNSTTSFVFISERSNNNKNINTEWCQNDIKVIIMYLPIRKKMGGKWIFLSSPWNVYTYFNLDILLNSGKRINNWICSIFLSLPKAIQIKFYKLKILCTTQFLKCS